MKIVTVLAAAALTVASTSSYAGNVSNVGIQDDTVIFVPEMAPAGSSASMGSLGSGGGLAIAALLGLAVLAAAGSGGGS